MLLANIASVLLQKMGNDKERRPVTREESLK